MQSVHWAMLTCLNISTLNLRIPDPPFVLPFDLPGGERYLSSPSVLSLDGYDFDRREWDDIKPPDRSAFRWDMGFWWGLEIWLSSWETWITSRQAKKWWNLRHIPIEQLNKTSLDLWLDTMDFSHIHTLELNHTNRRNSLSDQVIEKLPARLPALKSVRLFGKNADRFILALPEHSLSHLDWQEGYDFCDGRPNCLSEPLRAVLDHQGRSLESLHVHVEEQLSTVPRPTVSAQELVMIGMWVPSLKSLTIDLTRNESAWPWVELRILGRLPKLKELTIYFQLASECRRQKKQQWSPYGVGYPWHRDSCEDTTCVGPDQYAQPMLNETSAREMFEFLRKGKEFGDALAKVTFRAGDFEESCGQGPWLSGRKMWVTCNLTKSDSEGALRIACDGGDTLKEQDTSEMFWRDQHYPRLPACDGSSKYPDRLPTVEDDELEEELRKLQQEMILDEVEF
ncbi:hypothetical protein QBC46DRAFT_378878, partial [Diplogelasinospora grovesii]